MTEKTKSNAKGKAGKILLRILLCFIAVIAVIAIATAIANTASVKSSRDFIQTLSPVETAGLEPKIDEVDGYYTFTTDRELKVLRLTDVHLGAGFLSKENDIKAINAVAGMITEEKPDLVIVTGDISFPVPYIAGTLNNKNGAVLMAELMEQLGVYWCLAFGNHDTEAYSYFSRESISELYSNKEKYPHCLFQTGDEAVDGYGNYIVKVKKPTGEITQALIMLDSHSYVDGDIFGIEWKYDCVHENQVEWYENQIKSLTEQNYGIMPSSLVFFHIPPREMQEAYYDYRDNGFSDTENTKYLYGEAGEKDIVVYPSNYNYGLFDKALELGSTKGMFFGHDHLNNIALEYKGIQLSYGMSIDYLAYTDLDKYGAQRGCQIITVSPDGSFTSRQENYYQDKYQPVLEKEQVTMQPYYAE